VTILTYYDDTMTISVVTILISVLSQRMNKDCTTHPPATNSFYILSALRTKVTNSVPLSCYLKSTEKQHVPENFSKANPPSDTALVRKNPAILWSTGNSTSWWNGTFFSNYQSNHYSGNPRTMVKTAFSLSAFEKHLGPWILTAS